ncbi:MAG: hypothetical protein KAI83_00420 [Thiomargarita sp.]|nr:hypothetical protein [Thiomargarita sp.]
MAKKKKTVSDSATNRLDQKRVKIKEHQIDNRPVWRFSTVDRNGPFAWPKGAHKELDIVGKLHDFDSMTWSDISGKQHHYLSPSSLSKEAKQRLEELELDDEIENLFSFHLGGKPRIIAIKHANIAKLFWFDPEHQVAPSKKKHT